MRPGKTPEAGEPAGVGNEPELLALLRRVATLRGLHRKCHRPACKRARRCVGAEMLCRREQAGRPVPVRVIARRLAAFRRAMRSAPETPS